MGLTSLFLQLHQPTLVIDLALPDSPRLNAAAQALLVLDEAAFSKSPFWRDSLRSTLSDQEHPAVQILFHKQRALRCERSLITDGPQRVLVISLTESGIEGPSASSLLTMLDSLGAYVYCKDLSFRYTYANREVCELFRLPMEEIVGCTDDCFFGEQSAQKMIEESDQRVVATGEEIRREEVIYIPHEEEYRTYLSVKKPLFDDAGEMTGVFGISTDITAQKLIQQQLYDSERKLNTVLNNVGACIFIKDRVCRFTYINRSTERVFNVRAADVLGLSVLDLLGPEDGQALYRTDQQVFATGQPVKVLETFDTPNGEMHFWTEKIPIRNPEGEVDAYIGLATDITEQVTLERQLTEANQALQQRVEEITALKDELHQQAIRDPLTRLYNRRYLETQQDSLMGRAQRGEAFSLLMVDVDNFKQINDHLGHSVGDEILQQLAQVLREGCRCSDLICRYGGEEFLIAMPAMSVDHAEKKAEQLRISYQQLAKPSLPAGWNSTISVGVAAYPADGESFEHLLIAGDRALYQAKSKGRNRVERSQADDIEAALEP